MLDHLDHPTKRAAFVVTLAGVIVMIAAFLMIDPTNTMYNLLHLDFRYLFGHPYSHHSSGAIGAWWIGAVMFVGGGVVAFTRLVDWVISGKP